jgi:hypothetical protein
MSKHAKMNCTMTGYEKRSFIELNQNPYTAEVTTLPPSFDWKLKNVLGSLLN